MIQANLPPNESTRLTALKRYQILDTLPEQTYDDIAMLASQICETPIALISLVDEHRQWFKSRIGLPDLETERRIAFCAHSILEPTELTIIADAHKDERFSGNPLVTEYPKIRFYAGAPLITPDGEAIGTLCTIDRVPRELSDIQKNALRVLSKQVITELELRVKVAELEVMQEKLRNLSLQDDLTDLYNRRGFYSHVEQSLKLANRTKVSSAVVFVDLDGLKEINDTFGHDHGSQMIIETAGIMRKTFRESDIIARLGGDELAVFMIDITPENTKKTVDRLQARIDDFNRNSGHPYKLSVSTGAAYSSPDNKLTIFEMIKKADEAMYEEKRNKKNREA